MKNVSKKLSLLAMCNGFNAIADTQRYPYTTVRKIIGHLPINLKVGPQVAGEGDVF